ncbi:MAG: hypothetical protein ABH837_02170, partial [bacterium]
MNFLPGLNHLLPFSLLLWGIVSILIFVGLRLRKNETVVLACIFIGVILTSVVLSYEGKHYEGARAIEGLLRADSNWPFEEIIQVADEKIRAREFSFTTKDFIPACTRWQSGTSNTASGRHITVSVVPAADTPQIYLDEGLMYARITVRREPVEPL